MAAAFEIPIEPGHPALQDADWADCWEVEVQPPYANAREAATDMVNCFPAWMSPMLKLRDGLVSLAGLRTTKVVQQEGAEDVLGTVAFFPVISEIPGEIVLGTNDKHLDFRLVISISPGSNNGSQRISMQTHLKRHNHLGHAYLVVIQSFHRAACSGSLDNMVARRTAS
ncbi:MAG: DUF2867 domain-containing protein [Pseudomonadota bacterium]